MFKIKENYTHEEYLQLSKDEISWINENYQTNSLLYFCEDMRAENKNYKLPFEITGLPCVINKTLIIG